MGLEFFLFALMVFGMVLVVLYMVLRSKQQQSEGITQEDWAKREEKLMMLYFEVDDMINGLKEYVENAQHITELEYGKVEALMTAATKAPTAAPATVEQAPKEEPPAPPPTEETEDVAQQQDLARKERYEMATQLLREKVAPERIAEELHLSSSEITILQKLVQS